MKFPPMQSVMISTVRRLTSTYVSKREYTDAILSAMGGIKKDISAHIKGLLRLSDEALELADRHGIEERQLAPV